MNSKFDLIRVSIHSNNLTTLYDDSGSHQVNLAEIYTSLGLSGVRINIELQFPVQAISEKYKLSHSSFGVPVLLHLDPEALSTNNLVLPSMSLCLIPFDQTENDKLIVWIQSLASRLGKSPQ